MARVKFKFHTFTAGHVLLQGNFKRSFEKEQDLKDLQMPRMFSEVKMNQYN